MFTDKCVGRFAYRMKSKMYLAARKVTFNALHITMSCKHVVAVQNLLSHDWFNTRVDRAIAFNILYITHKHRRIIEILPALLL